MLRPIRQRLSLSLRTRVPVVRRRLALLLRRGGRLGRAAQDCVGHCVTSAPAGRRRSLLPA
ncbi:MAG: hypothetical protein JHC40_03265 [Burkholderiales bacterium]|nr:hypothetical protein [Burkholderiales bacterium]